MPKTIISLGSKRFNRIGRIETNKILNDIKNYTVRSKLKNKIKYYKFGASGKDSLKNITENIGKTTHSSLAVDKFVRAVLGRGKSGLSLERKEANLKRAQRDRMDEGGITREVRETKFAGNAVSTSSIGVSNVPEEMGAKRIGVNAGPVGFAGGQTGKATIGVNSKN